MIITLNLFSSHTNYYELNPEKTKKLINTCFKNDEVSFYEGLFDSILPLKLKSLFCVASQENFKKSWRYKRKN